MSPFKKLTVMHINLNVRVFLQFSLFALCRISLKYEFFSQNMTGYFSFGIALIIQQLGMLFSVMIFVVFKNSS